MLIMHNSSSLFLEKAKTFLTLWGNWDSYGEDQVKHTPCCIELDLSVCHLHTWYMAGTQYTFAQWMNVAASGSAGIERRERALWIGGYNHPFSRCQSSGDLRNEGGSLKLEEELKVRWGGNMNQGDVD